MQIVWFCVIRQTFDSSRAYVKTRDRTFTLLLTYKQGHMSAGITEKECTLLCAHEHILPKSKQYKASWKSANISFNHAIQGLIRCQVTQTCLWIRLSYRKAWVPLKEPCSLLWLTWVNPGVLCFTSAQDTCYISTTFVKNYWKCALFWCSDDLQHVWMTGFVHKFKFM